MLSTWAGRGRRSSETSCSRFYFLDLVWDRLFANYVFHNRTDIGLFAFILFIWLRIKCEKATFFT